MKKVFIIIVAFIVLSTAVYYTFREDNPIGHFKSEEGKDDFYNAYKEAMALLPEPQETQDHPHT